MKISVVTVTFNCGKTIQETIQSVIEQTYQNIEYILIDGGSKDETVNIIKEYESRIAYWKSECDKGIFDAMNKSLDHVTGDYVIFMNAGDRFANNHVIADVFENKCYEADIIYGDSYTQNELGYLLRKANAIYLKKYTTEDLVLKSQGICHQSIFTKTVILKTTKFNLAFPLGADYDTTARVFNNGNHQLVYTGFPISIFDDRTGGSSHNQIMKVLKERSKMFHYHTGIKFYYFVYSRIAISKFKLLLEMMFLGFVKKYRRLKYLKTV